MYCPSCGKPADASVRYCPACGAQVGSGNTPGASSGAAAGGAYPPNAYPQRKLVRPRYPRMIAGVCAAFSLQFGWDITLVRVITAALAVLTSGAVGLAYLVAWVIIPEAPYALPVGAPGYPQPGYPPAGYGAVATPPPGAASAPPPPSGGAAV